MKKSICIVLFFMLGILPTNAQKKGFPQISFEKTVYDYDSILQGSNGMCTFLFKNTGDAPLIISSTSSSCGCTKPTFVKTPIMPGEESKITVKYNTSLVGDFRKTIVVKSNAKNKPVSILQIKGYVKTKK